MNSPLHQDSVGLIAIINPVGAAPSFISLTLGIQEVERRRIANIVIIAVTIVLLVTLVCSESILGFFGISINSFRVAGGILLLLIAILMLHALSVRW